MILTKPSAIIFDFDDTLIESMFIVRKALSSTFADFNIKQEILEGIDFNRSLKDYFHIIFADNIEGAREAYLAYYAKFSSDLKMMPDAEAVLSFLKHRQIYTAIVSNKGGDRLRGEVSNKFKWDDYFAAVIGSGDAVEDKPSAAPAILALKNAKLENYNDVWLIGDSLVDLQTAHNLGCKAILYGNNPQDVKPDMLIENHQQLLKLLERIYA